MSAVRHRHGDEAWSNRMKPSKEDRSFKTFVWNPKTRAVLGRTAASWGRALVFFSLFYIFLAAFSGAMMYIFYQTLDDRIPTYTGKESLLRAPGLSIRPETRSVMNQRPYLVYSLEDYMGDHYSDSIRRFLLDYERPRSAHTVNCSPTDGYREDYGPVCDFDVGALNTTCTDDNKFGYESNSPCVLLKINKAIHWKPSPILDLDILPEGLQKHINASENPRELMKQNAWLWCESDDAELEQSSPGLHISYFPYSNQEGYLNPFTFVRLLNLTVNTVTMVRCRVWASGVEHSSEKQRGELAFYIAFH